LAVRLRMPALLRVRMRPDDASGRTGTARLHLPARR
jgi:hypothetical protein